MAHKVRFSIPVPKKVKKGVFLREGIKREQKSLSDFMKFIKDELKALLEK